MLPMSQKRRRALFVWFAPMVALAAMGAAPANATSAISTVGDSVRTIPTPKRGRVTDHVIVISIDGLRPDAIEQFGAKTLMRLMREGAYSLKAQTILPSKTLPSHTSMLTGVDADQHGITWNSDDVSNKGHVDVPTIFGLARDAGFTSAAFFSKTKFHHLEVPNSLDHVRSPKGGILDSKWTARKTVGEVRHYLESKSATPNVMFVHIGEPDFAGHLFGWMGRVYAGAVREADTAVGDILSAADQRFGRGNYTVIVTADHGGHGRNHGSEDPRDTTIPWIVWGQGVESGAAVSSEIQTMDTAATALWMLGVNAPSAWVGTAITSAFPATLAATRQ